MLTFLELTEKGKDIILELKDHGLQNISKQSKFEKN